jgi:hypothetical protein
MGEGIPNDGQLLREFAATGSAQAFAEVVRRHNAIKEC